MKNFLWSTLSGQDATLWEALFNSLWQGIIIVAAVWLILLAFPRLNAATRYAAWYATLLAVAILPFVSGRFTGPGAAPAQEPAPRAQVSTADYVSAPSQSQPSARRASSSTSQGRSSRSSTSPHAAPPTTSAPRVATVRKEPTGRVSTPESWAVRVNGGAWLFALGVVWLLGVAWKWTRLAVSLRRIRAIKSRAELMEIAPGGTWPAWRARSRRGTRVWLGWSDEIQVPGVFGFVRPAILFPRLLQGALSESEMEQVALHELAHISRYDDWWQVVQRVIEGALFFHPAVRFVSQRLALEREIACDDWVLHRVKKPREYAGCLARLAEHRSLRPLPVPGAALSKKHIVRRIEMLMSNNRNTRPSTSRAITALAALWLAIAIVQVGFVRPLVAVTPELTAPKDTPVAKVEPRPAEALSEAISAGFAASVEYREARTPAPSAAASVAVNSDRTSAPAPTPEAPEARPARSGRSRETSTYWAQAGRPAPVQPLPPVPHVRPQHGRPSAPAPPATPAPPAPPATPEPPVTRKGFTSERWDDGTNLTINHDGDEVTWIWSDGGHKIRVEMDGRVEFDPQGTALRGISSDGFFIVQERLKGRTRELEVVPGRHDSLEYYYFEDDETRPYNDAARRWFAELLPTLMRETGLGAKERVAALRTSGGTTAVLDEIHLIESDYVKRIYFVELLDSGTLSQDELRTIFRAAGRQLDSDYEMAELLIEYADLVGGDAATLEVFVEAVGQVDSDYEVRRILTALAEREELTQPYAQAVLELASTMESDYEKAELLQDLAEFSRDDATLRDLYVDAVASMESDYEKRRVLEELLETRHSDAAFVEKVLDVAGTMESEYEQAELLIHLADLARDHDAALSGYIRAVESIDSDYEARRVLTAMSWREDLPESVSLELLDAVSRLDSDYEKAEFLLEHHEIFASPDTVRDAFDRTLDTISSDYERDRVEAAFYRKTRKSSSRGGSY